MPSVVCIANSCSGIFLCIVLKFNKKKKKVNKVPGLSTAVPLLSSFQNGLQGFLWRIPRVVQSSVESFEWVLTSHPPCVFLQEPFICLIGAGRWIIIIIIIFVLLLPTLGSTERKKCFFCCVCVVEKTFLFLLLCSFFHFLTTKKVQKWLLLLRSWLLKLNLT